MQFRLFPFRHPRFPPFPAIRGPKEEGQKLCAGDTAEALCLNSGLAVQGEATRYVAHRILFSRTKENFPKQHFSFFFSLSLSLRSREKYGKGVAERKEERKMRLVRRSSVSRPLWRMDRDLDQSFSGGGRRRGRHAITPFPPLREGWPGSPLMLSSTLHYDGIALYITPFPMTMPPSLDPDRPKRGGRRKIFVATPLHASVSHTHHR